MSACWSPRLILARLSAALLLVACGGGPEPSPTTRIAKVDGDNQTGTVRQQLALPLRVIVIEGGSPVAGAMVTWSTDVEGGSFDPDTSETGADGSAATAWTLGNFARPQGAQASLEGGLGSPVNFRADAVHDAPDTLTKYSGDNQVGQPNSYLGVPLRAQVADQFGNGIPGVEVFWTATGATISAPMVPTNVSGLSVVEVMVGEDPDLAMITAAVEGLPGSPVTFGVSAGPR